MNEVNRDGRIGSHLYRHAQPLIVDNYAALDPLWNPLDPSQLGPELLLENAEVMPV